MKQKNGFTIVEILIAFTIIGVISIITMHTISERFTDFYSRYSVAFDALTKAVYNVKTDTYCVSGLESCLEDGAVYKSGRPFPKSTKNLRKRLAEYLNITEDSEEHLNSDSIETIKNANSDEFNEKSAQLYLTNGFIIYFSEPKTINIKIGGTSETKTLNYFIAYVDLNGKAHPNKADKHPDFFSNSTKKVPPTTPKPDIVPFIFTFNGEVIPVGFPIYDKHYVSARILNSNNDQSESFTVDEARQIAFGNKAYLDIPITLIPQIQKAKGFPQNIKPSVRDSVPTHGISSGVPDGYNCEEGTYNCTISFDGNQNKRF